MRKTINIFVVVTMMMLALPLLVPFSYSHPDISQISFETGDGTIPDITVMGLKDTQKESDDIKYEFLTQEWFSQNIILLLSGIISITVGITVVANFREEIFVNIIKGSMNNGKT